MRCNQFALRAIVVAIGAIAWQQALPNPTGGKVSAGQGTISQSGSAMTITQSSQNLSLNWQSFNIAPSESVRFAQPNANSIALNRVLGSNASEIFGTLRANGQVFLINPNGVLFGPSAQVDVGGLVASALNLSDSDFLAGRLTFSGSGGSVVNQGTINANNGYVALLGRQVSNQGTITAQLGTVALAAGDQVTLDLSGDHLIHVQVDKSALNALADNKQLIQADGGKVIMSTGAKDALLDTVVNNDGVIQARTMESRDGQIVLLGGMDSGVAQVNGTLDASAPNGGDGGTIETSAAQVKVGNSAVITTAATNGKTGTWLIDPKDYTVAAKGGDITGAALSSNLATSNVTIQSSDGKKNGSGDVNVNDAVNWSANTTLTMTASNNVNVNATIEADGMDAGIAINPNTANGKEAASGSGQLNFGQGATINLPNVSPSSTTALVISGTPYVVINSLGAPGSTTDTDLQGINGSGNYALGDNINASATAGWNGGAGFAPIGSLSGTFQGLGHTIDGLTINRPSSTGPVGLFASIGSLGRIMNVGLVDANVVGNSSVGALVGFDHGEIANSYSGGSVSGKDSVGGLVGSTNESPNITNSYSTASVNGTSSVGGLVGTDQETGISNSFATGNVTGRNDNVGGLVGANNGPIKQSHATGSVTSFGNNVGGLVGAQNHFSINDSYATGGAAGNAFVGGLVGSNSGSVSGSHSTGNVFGRFITSGDLGGLVGLNSSGTVTNSYSSGSVGAGGSHTANIGGLVGANADGGTVSDSFSTGVVLGGASSTGGLIGFNTGGSTVSSSFSSGEVGGLSGVGGLVGLNDATISNSYSTSAVTGIHSVGGLVGTNLVNGTVNNSYSVGPVHASGPEVGGLVAVNFGSVSNSFWDIQTSGLTTSAGGVGLTTRKMQTPATFIQAGWDRNIWLLRGNRYPQLRVFAQ